MANWDEIIEIKNFDLRIYKNQYWIKYDEDQYPIVMTPYNLLKLFEIEGIRIVPETLQEEAVIHFGKAVLLRRYWTNVDVEGDPDEPAPILPYPCWVKL